MNFIQTFQSQGFCIQNKNLTYQILIGYSNFKLTFFFCNSI